MGTSAVRSLLPSIWEDNPEEGGRVFVTTKSTDKGVLSYKRVRVPSSEEASSWVEALAAVPEEGDADVTMPTDFAFRYCALAYARNNGGDQVVATIFRSRATGRKDALELQLHGSDDFRAGAHLVAYLYGMPGGGVGVVLAYKGSTLNSEDWRHNLHIVTREAEAVPKRKGVVHWGVDMFPDLMATTVDEAVRECQVFRGFRDYWKVLDDLTSRVSLLPWADLLAEWGAPLDPDGAKDLRSWLHAGSWRWCAVVGHSLGGAMAEVAATDLAVRSGRRVCLATLGSPSVGNCAFMRLEKKLLLPAGGGLEMLNKGDTVPLMGYHGFKLWTAQRFHSGRILRLGSNVWEGMMDPYHTHLTYTIPSTALGEGRLVEFRFPGMSYKPSATHDCLECTLGDIWSVATTD